MKRFLLFLMLCGTLRGADFVITATVTITNASNITGTNAESITVNSDTRTWTNSLHSPATQILKGTNIAQDAQALLIQTANYPFANVRATGDAISVVTFRGSNNVTMAVTLSPTNWGYSILTTQTVGSATVVRVPYTVESPATQTNNASGVAIMVNAPANTNGIAGNKFNSLLSVPYGLALHGLAKTNSYSLTADDLYVGADTRSNTNLILTLPSAASASNQLYLLKDEGGAGATNTLKIHLQSGDRIDSLLTNLVVSNNFGGVMLRSRGSTNWSLIASGGGVTGGVGGGGGGVEWTNTVWVAANGNDSTGARGDLSKPFLTLGAAKTNAISGDTIFVMPGTWDEMDLLKDGVNWHFFPGARVRYTGDYTGSSATAVFDASGGGTFVCSITGCGDFETTNAAGGNIVAVWDNDSDVKFQARTMTINTGDAAAVYLGTGHLTVSDALITTYGRPPFRVDTSGTLQLSNVRVVRAAGTYANGSVMELASTSTNVTIRDSVLEANTAASSPVIISGAYPVHVQGTVTTSDADIGAVPVFSTNRIYGGGVPYNDTVHHDTNSAPLNIDTSDFALDTNYTNGNQRAWVSASLLLTSDATNTAQVSLYLDQDASGGFEQTGITVQTLGAVTNSVCLSGFVQPNAIFIFTNLSAAGATAAINAGGSQWVKQ
jgi:hypothetical protein